MRNVQIDFTDYPIAGFYTPDFETSGIRVYQGEAILTVDWQNLDKVTILGWNTKVTPFRLKGELVLRGGEMRSVELAANAHTANAVTGKTELGDFAIPLEKVKTLTPIVQRVNAKP